MYELDEKNLLQSAKEGNKIAFEQLIINYEVKVYNIAYQIIQNEEDAKDIAQITFIKIFKSLKKFNETCSFSTWIYRITVNTCYDELRRRKNKKRNDTYSLDEQQTEKLFYDENKDSNQFSPEQKIIKKERISELYKALNKLDKKHRTLIILRDIQGFSYKQISDIMNMKEGTVKSGISRARNKLKKILMDSELFITQNV